jgi:hypothetical protein
MTYIDDIINKNPIKYNSLIKSNITNKKLKMKLNEYNAIQEEYAVLLSKQISSKPEWKDIPNINYSSGILTTPKSETENWKYLGESNTLEDCKLQSINNKQSFSSVVYYPGDMNNGWDKTCYGSITNNPINPVEQDKVTTSIPPNNSTALGGEEGLKLLAKMKKIQSELDVLIKNQTNNISGLDKSNSNLKVSLDNENYTLDELIEKLKKDRVELDKVLEKTDNSEYIGDVKESSLQEGSAYTKNIIWLILVIIVFYLLISLYYSDYYNISSIIYYFVSIFTIFIILKYYSEISYYGNKITDFFSYLINLFPRI